MKLLGLSAPLPLNLEVQSELTHSAGQQDKPQVHDGHHVISFYPCNRAV